VDFKVIGLDDTRLVLEYGDVLGCCRQSKKRTVPCSPGEFLDG